MKPYPAYKPSGVPWLGEIPAHWEVQRLRFRCKLNPSVKDGLSDSDVVSFLPMEAVGDDGSLNLEATRLVGDVASGYTYFEDGDVTIAKITPCFENGKGAVMRGLRGGIGFGTTELIVIRPNDSAHPDWLYYITQSDAFRKRGEAMMNGAGGQKRVPDLFVKDLPVAWPQIKEQKIVAAYLDRETARIDTLIAEKGRLTDTLREYRQATIDSALARGLKEGVTIVSTKQAWWGSIPQHWALLPLKRIVGIRITDGPHETPELVEQGVPFVSAEAIKGGRVDFNQRRGNITPELHEIFCKKARPRRGDVFVVKSGATTGNVGFVDTDDEFSIWSPLALVRYSDGYSDGRYLFWAMSSNAFRLAVRMHWSAGTQPNLGMAVLENLSIPVPPFDEQQAIATYLDHETARIDKLVDHVQDEIKLLQELRAATITDAVTGKIQVS